MKNKVIVVTEILLIASLVNYFSFISDGSIRSVEFISIFAIGVLAGILISNLITMLKNKK